MAFHPSLRPLLSTKTFAFTPACAGWLLRFLPGIYSINLDFRELDSEGSLSSPNPAIKEEKAPWSVLG
jgi:hypothetical protein